MKKNISLFLLLFLSLNAIVAQTVFNSIATGNWNSASSWDVNAVPSSLDIVNITSGTIISSDGINVAGVLTINAGGTLNASSNSLTISNTLTNNGTVNIYGTASLNITASATTGITNNAAAQFNISAGTLNLGTAGGSNRTFSNSGSLTVSGGTLNINGNFLNTSSVGNIFTQSGGDINVDGNAAGISTNSVAAATPIVKFTSGTPTTVFFTSGTFTIVDPSWSSGYVLYTDISTTINCNTTHTFRFGDGVSTDTGGTNGFYMNLWPLSARLILGNVVANGGSATNRFVTSYYSHGILGDLIINENSEYRINTSLYLAGNILNNGILTTTSTLNLASYANAIVAPATNAQSIGGTGVFRNATTSASSTANFYSLSTNNNSGGGITLNVPLSVSNSLTMTSGMLHTTATNLLSLGTATIAGTLTCTPSTSNMIDGPFARTFPSLRTATGTYTTATLYPVGKSGVCLPLHIDPSTKSTGAVVFKAEAFASNAGTYTSPVTSLSSNRWEALITSGAANFTSMYIGLNDASLGANHKILQANAADGNYTTIVPSSTFVTGTPNAIRTSGTQILAADYLGYFGYGTAIPCIVPTTQPTAFVASSMSSTSFTGSFTPAATPTPSHYLVVRYLTSTAIYTDPTDYKEYALNATLGIGLTNTLGTVVSISNATTFTQTGLTTNTSYTYKIYSYNNTGCSGPIYNVNAPLQATITTCPTMTTPTILSSSAITSSSFNVSWTGIYTSYELDVSTVSNFATFVTGYNALVVTSPSSYTIGGLMGSTTYYVRVRGISGVCRSASSSSLIVTTTCIPLTVPTITEGFNSYVPVCWKEATGTLAINTTTSGTSSSWTAETGFGNSGTNPAVKINLYGTKNDWLISPPIDLGTGGNWIKYNMAVTAYYNSFPQATLGTHKVSLVISTDGGVTWSNTNIVKTYTDVGNYSNTGQQEVITIPSYTGIVKIAFVATTTSSSPDVDFHIDDFRVEPIAPPNITTISPNTCNGPATLTITGTNLISASNVSVGGVPVTILTNTDTKITATVNAGTSGIVVVTTSSGTATSSTIYTVGNLGTVSATPSTASFCGVGGTSTLTAASSYSGYTYAWTTPTSTATLSATSGASIAVTVTETSDFILVATDAGLGCIETATTTVGVYPFPTSTPYFDQNPICFGSSTILHTGLSSTNFSNICIPYAPLVAPSNAVTLCIGGVQTIPLTGGNFDDGGWANIPLGFNFNYYGTVYSNVSISTNGMIAFGPVTSYGSGNGNLGQYTFNGPPQGFPSTSNPPNVVAVLATDLYAPNGGSIRYWIKGTSPNRIFVLEYRDIPGYTHNGLYTFQGMLFETTGNVEMHVTQATGTGTGLGGPKYIGLQDATRTIGATATNCATNTPFYWNGSTDIITSAAPQAWRFIPPHTYTVSFDFASEISGPNGGPGLYNVIALPTAPGIVTYKMVYFDPITGCDNEAAPTTINLIVDPVTVAGTLATTDPTIFCAGTSNTTTLNLSDNVGAILKWQYSTNNGSNWSDIANTTSTLTVTNLTQTRLYRAVVKSGVCNTEMTNAIALTVLPASVGGLLTTSSASSVCIGTNNGVLNLGSYTGTLLYWQKSTDAGTTWNTISNTTTAQTFSNLTQTTKYRAVVQNGSCPLAYSSAFTITVNALPLAAITGTATICKGATTTLIATGGTLYNWGTGFSSTATLTTPALNSNATYAVTVQNAYGCTASASQAISVGVYLTVTNPATVCYPYTVDITAPAVTLGSDLDLSFSYHDTPFATGVFTGGDPTAISVGNTFYIKGENRIGCFDIKPVVVTIKAPKLSNASVPNIGPDCVDPEGYTLYTAAANVYFGIKWGALNTGIGKPSQLAKVSIAVNTGGTPWSNGNGTQTWFVMGRHWDVNLNGSTIDPTEPVSVRFIYSQTELDAMNTAATNLGGTLGTPNWFKMNNGITFDPTNPAMLTPNGLANSFIVNNVNNAPTPLTWGGLKYAQFNGLTGFSGGTYAVPVNSSSILPVTLASFNGKKVDEQVKLNWVTASEYNSKSFVIEKSTDGIHFKLMTEVAAAGTSKEVHTYEQYDKDPSQGDNYYRLISIDNDGTTRHIGNIIKINFSNASNTISIYPNPVNSELTIELYQNEAINLHIQVLDITGKLLSTTDYSLEKGQNIKKLEVRSLRAGTYLLQVLNENNEQVEILRFVKMAE